MYRYTITQKEANACMEHYLGRKSRRAMMFVQIILASFALGLWYALFLFLGFVQTECAESGWIRTWPLPGDVVDFFCFCSALVVVSCLIQKKKFSKASWEHVSKTKKYRDNLAQACKKMAEGERWGEPDMMEYDPENKEIRLLNKNQRTYRLPSGWESSLVDMGDGLRYAVVWDEGKRVIIPFRDEASKQASVGNRRGLALRVAESRNAVPQGDTRDQKEKGLPHAEATPSPW